MSSTASINVDVETKVRTKYNSELTVVANRPRKIRKRRQDLDININLLPSILGSELLELAIIELTGWSRKDSSCVDKRF